MNADGTVSDAPVPVPAAEVGGGGCAQAESSCDPYLANRLVCWYQSTLLEPIKVKTRRLSQSLRYQIPHQGQLVCRRYAEAVPVDPAAISAAVPVAPTTPGLPGALDEALPELASRVGGTSPHVIGLGHFFLTLRVGNVILQ
jgi:hypothetical protein